ncbi:MAG: hypothetical protein V3W18_04240, partial [candidate division Zixibacteria bacterium]
MRPFKIIAIMVFLVSLAYLISCTDRKITNRHTKENFTDSNVWRYSIRNHPESEIKYQSPANGATDIGIDFELIWNVVDPGSEMFACEVYLSPNPDPRRVSLFYPRESYISPWRIRERCIELLQQIYSAQQSYRQQYGVY